MRSFSASSSIVWIQPWSRSMRRSECRWRSMPATMPGTPAATQGRPSASVGEEASPPSCWAPPRGGRSSIARNDILLHHLGCWTWPAAEFVQLPAATMLSHQLTACGGAGGESCGVQRTRDGFQVQDAPQPLLLVHVVAVPAAGWVHWVSAFRHRVLAHDAAIAGRSASGTSAVTPSQAHARVCRHGRHRSWRHVCMHEHFGDGQLPTRTV